jgi:recombination protein RecR
MVQALEKLVDALSRLPTIGRKSAWRLALHLVERPAEELAELARAIGTLKQSVVVCRECFNYADSPVCAICSSPSRDTGVICVVEKPTDVLAIEKAGRYRGMYHVLGGHLSPINGITAEKLTIAQLKKRVEDKKPREIILGLGGSGDAETTALYISRILAGNSARVTRLARGLPAGLELEHIDQITLTQAMQERTEIKYQEHGHL